MPDMPALAARPRRRVPARLLAMLLLVTAGAGAQSAPELGTGTPGLPFSIGERLTYRVKSGKFGAVGRGVMTVDGPVDVRGTATYLLRSEMHARVGFIGAMERAESWLDPSRMMSLRFRKQEKRAFIGKDAQVELYPDERRWQEPKGRMGESPTDAPLDELSFIYFVRTLALDTDTVMQVVRHYDADRNPVRVRVIGRDSIMTGAGAFRTIVVEMRVKERGHYDGEGTIRIHLSDDARRIPVRIESLVPILGQTVLTLDSVSPRIEHVRLAPRPE